MKAIKYFLLLMLLSTNAPGQIVVINPGNPPTTPPIDPPGPRNPIPVRPDPTRPGGGDFDGKFYEYCGPSYLGYKCNFMRTEAVARMRDEFISYGQRNLNNYQMTLNAETAKVDKDLEALRNGQDVSSSPAGVKIKGKLEQAGKFKASAEAIDDETIRTQIKATHENSGNIDVSFGLAFRDKDKTEYKGEADKVNLVVADRFVKARITREQERADAIEAQIRNGSFDNKDDRLALVSGGRAALEISAQSLQEGDVGKSNFALKVGTALLDTAISLTPVLGWGKDAYEALMGKNLLTGEELSRLERTLAIVGVLTAGIGSKLAIAAKASVIIGISKAAKGADEAAEIAKMADKAIEFSESANNALKAGENTIGFAKGAGVLAFANKSRSQHAARHLTDAGILPNWSNATFEKFKDIGIQIVENPLKTFDHTLGQTAVKGFHGKVDDKNVVMFIYKEGPYVAQIATSIVPSPQQIINWGLK